MEKGVILQYFEWYTPSEPHLWVELKENAKKLKEAGFSAIGCHQAIKVLQERMMWAMVLMIYMI